MQCNIIIQPGTQFFWNFKTNTYKNHVKSYCSTQHFRLQFIPNWWLAFLSFLEFCFSVLFWLKVTVPYCNLTSNVNANLTQWLDYMRKCSAGIVCCNLEKMHMSKLNIILFIKKELSIAIQIPAINKKLHPITVVISIDCSHSLHSVAFPSISFTL